MGEVKTKNHLPTWKRLLEESVVDPDALPWPPSCHPEKLKRVISRYPMRINPYYLG
jgi:lysine 2,3-aminomutase